MLKKRNSRDNYRPLSEKLTIHDSDIEGLGLFAAEDIPVSHDLGLSHLIIAGELIRTPLGGFYNHSDEPNCVKVRIGDKFYLKSLREISMGEEITVKYTFYYVEN